MFQHFGISILVTTVVCWFGSISTVSTCFAQTDWPIVEYSSTAPSVNLGGYPPLPEGAVLIPSTIVSGSAAEPTRELLAEIERSREELDADRLPDLPETQRAVVRAMVELESYIQRHTPAENYSAWMRYLKLDPLIEAIETDGSIDQRGRAAVELQSRLRGIEAGLELRPMRTLRDAIADYVAALLYSNPKRGIASVEKQLDALVDLLSPQNDDLKEESETKKSLNKKSSDKDKDQGVEDADDPARSPRSLSELTPQDLAQLELLIGGLSDANQAERLINRIRSHYNEPNLRGWLDGRFITDALARPVDNPNDVNDCILGTRLIGNARVSGNVTGQLLPADGHVRLLLRMDGLFSTSARGFRKPISLDTTGTGNVYAARQLAVTERGITLGETIATADLTTQIQRINHPLKIVRRIALKKAGEQRPQAEAISREKLRNQIYRQFDEQTAEAAARTFPDLDALINPWLQRLDVPPLQRTIGSTTDTVYVRGTIQRATGLAAYQPPPALSMIQSASGNSVLPGGYLGAVQIHQSVLDNSIIPLLAGETLSPKRIERLASGLGLELPPRKSKPASTSAGDSSDNALELDDVSSEGSEEEEEEEEEEEQSFEVDLASFRPVFLEADDQTLRVGLRGTRFSQGDRELKRTLEVAAVYRPVRGDDGVMWLVRDEEVSLSFPGTRRLTIGQTAIKSNMEKSFNDLFPPELLRRSFPIPNTVEMPALAGRILKITAIDLTDGWISIAVR
jgi:hypothetical protein